MSVTDELKKASYESLSSSVKQLVSIRAEFNLDVDDAVLIAEARAHADTLFIAATGGRKRGGGGGGFPPKGDPTDYKCPNCGSAVLDMRSHKSKENAPDFKCTSCKNDKGYKTGWWLKNRDGSVRTPDQIFGVSSVEEAFSNEALESSHGGDELPF